MNEEILNQKEEKFKTMNLNTYILRNTKKIVIRKIIF